MKSPLSILIFTLTALATLASGLKLAQKAVLFSYPSATPQDVVDAAMAAIVEAGGFVSHEFKIFKGFAATIPPKSIDMISSLSVEFKPTVEEDQVVGILED